MDESATRPAEARPHRSVVSQGELAPLTPSDRSAARAAAERLAIEVTRLLGSINPNHRNASALARLLDIERTTCQRLLASVSTVDEWTLTRAPGAKALQTLIDAAERRGVDTAVVRGLREAAAGLEAIFDSAGGTQRAFTQRLLLATATQRDAAGHEDTENDLAESTAADARKRLFDAACELTGRWSDVQTQVAVIRPSSDIPNACDVARARGLIGHVQRSGAVPLVFTHLFGTTDAHRRRYAELQRPSSSDEQRFLLDQFCTPSWRVMSFVDGDTLIQSVSAESEGRGGTPGDLVVGSASFGAASDPRHDMPPLEEVWASVEYPTRRLILDVYLHNDLARGCTSGADVHTLRSNDPRLLQQTHRRWMTRIGAPVALSMLGAGLGGAGCDAYPRQSKLIEFLFDAVGWRSREFVGFRLDLTLPIWRTAVRTYFSFDSK